MQKITDNSLEISEKRTKRQKEVAESIIEIDSIKKTQLRLLERKDTI